MEKLLENKMEEHNRCSNQEALFGAAVILGSVALFGFFCDKFLQSEEKAEEARKRGYDI